MDKRCAKNSIGKDVPVLGILILNQNGKEWLSSLYDSLRAQDYTRAMVYLVDNASDDGSVEMTFDKYPEVTVIQMPQNLGFCMAYNLSMPHAFSDGCDWIIWANNDIKLEKVCLAELARVAQSDPRIGVLGPAFLAWESDHPNYYIIGNHPYAIPSMKSKSHEPIDVEWVEGSFLMVSRRCIEAVGPLDPYLFYYWEEADFCRRARFRGWRVVLVPSALARHYARGSTNQQNEAFLNMVQSRNYYIYKLANPFQSFSRNMLETVHLFGVKIKEHLNNHSATSISFETRVLLSILRNLRTVFLKWQRDAAGRKPPTTTPDLQSLRPEILRSHSHFEERHDLSFGSLRANI